MWLLRTCKSLYYPVISQLRLTKRLTPICTRVFSIVDRSASSTMSEMASIEAKTVSDETKNGESPAATATGAGVIPCSQGKLSTSESDAKDTETTDDSALKKLSRRAMKREKETNCGNQIRNIMRAKHRIAAKEGRPIKRRKKNDTKELNFTEKGLNDADYYFENGLRKVYPYYFTFTTYAKGRWVGEKILDIFAKEFKAYDISTYEKAINSGRVTVNGKAVSTDYVFIDNDYVENIVHRHELSVTAAPIQIVTETEDVVVVDKPSSIPIHPCGRYRHNSLTYLIAKEHGLRNLRTIYRLDRLTSGVFIFCKNDKQTLMMQNHIKNRKVEKTYLARVVGEFPSEPIECTGSIDTLSHKIGLFKIGPDGKEARTNFKRLSYNGETSVVECKPHTGRTHQIRVHLQYLGYPIVNDPLYNSPAWGPKRGKGGDYCKTEEELVEELIKYHSAERFTAVSDDVAAERNLVSPETAKSRTSPEQDAPSTTPPSNVCDSNPKPSEEDMICERSGELESSGAKAESGVATVAELDSAVDEATATPVVSKADADSAVNKTVSGAGAAKLGFEPSKLTHDPLCEECRRAYIDPQPDDLVMFLHALSYSGPGWSFATEMPDWAQEDWTPQAKLPSKA